MMETPRFELTASPHIKGPESTSRIMWTVVWSLVPVILASFYYFGPSALLVISASTAGCLVTERVFSKTNTLGDGSALITGLLLGLTLPAGIPMWMAAIGGIFAIGIGKVVFGGLGQNVFNPALLGRAFLQAAFPTAMTTWPDLQGPWMALRGDNLAFPFATPHVVTSMTGATPLGVWKFGGKLTGLAHLILGSTGGSLGETAAIVILACGVFLAFKKYLDWRIPISIFATVFILSEIIHAVAPAHYPDGFFMLFSGGLMLGAVFMATDMVTSPTTKLGAWIFGVGIGVMVVVIRLWGGLPEGVMYSILFMNAFVPFINRATQPRVFGTGRAVRAS